MVMDNTTQRKSSFARNMFHRDWAAMIVLQEQRKAVNAAVRAKLQADVGLCELLAAEAARRGQPGIDWPEYFRNSYLAD